MLLGLHPRASAPPPVARLPASTSWWRKRREGLQHWCVLLVRIRTGFFQALSDNTASTNLGARADVIFVEADGEEPAALVGGQADVVGALRVFLRLK
jgi:hypothetical protein